MTGKVYRTAQGKMVDLGAMQLRNEQVRAVGNMGVNARGDRLDANNRPIQSRNKQVARQYARQTGNVVDEPVLSSAATPRRNQLQDVPPPPEDFDDDFEKPAEVKSSQPAATEGLAAAMARARKVTAEK